MTRTEFRHRLRELQRSRHHSHHAEADEYERNLTEDYAALAARVEALEAEVALRKAAAEEPWSFHRGSLHERLDWCRVQHLNAAENPPERPPSREAKADFDRACVEWYEEMIAQCEELEALAAVPSADEKEPAQSYDSFAADQGAYDEREEPRG